MMTITHSLIFTTFFMGLAGGPHCIAMCGAACNGISQGAGKQGLWQFHLGRVAGYASLGAVAATSVSGLAWFSSQTAALHPLWTFFHVIVLVWGLMLLLSARQPAWVDNMGKNLWRAIRQFSQIKGGALVTGMLWAFMPCGLLYSAVLVAALSGNAGQGALSMAAFALGSSLSLIIGPWLWQQIKSGKLWLTESRGMRIAGFLLVCTASFAIWMDIVHHTQPFCISR